MRFFDRLTLAQESDDKERSTYDQGSSGHKPTLKQRSYSEDVPRSKGSPLVLPKPPLPAQTQVDSGMPVISEESADQVAYVSGLDMHGWEFHGRVVWGRHQGQTSKIRRLRGTQPAQRLKQINVPRQHSQLTIRALLLLGTRTPCRYVGFPCPWCFSLH